jgi:hypothetical protein
VWQDLDQDVEEAWPFRATSEIKPGEQNLVFARRRPLANALAGSHAGEEVHEAPKRSVENGTGIGPRVETVEPLGALLSEGSVLTAGRREIRDGLNFAERSTAVARRATKRVTVEHVNVHAGRPFSSAKLTSPRSARS